MNTDLHIVLGGSGGVGSALTKELIKREKNVRTVDRSLKKDAQGYESVSADVLDYESLLKACQGARVFYHCLGVPYPLWSTFFPQANKNVIQVAKTIGAKIVYTDNLYMYSEDAAKPLTENSPQNPKSKKGKLRKQLADELMEAHAQGIPVAICRAADYFGPSAPNSYINSQIFARIAKGQSAQLLGNADVPKSSTYIKDFAAALATCGEKDEAFGHVWHVPGIQAMTMREFAMLVFKEMSKEPKIEVISPFMMTLLAPFVSALRPLKELKYQYTEPFTYTWSKYEQTFGPAQVTPLEQAIEETLDWYQKG